jgi:hypothetical protein
MTDNPSKKLLDEERKTIISNATMTAIIIITNEIEGYMRQYIDKGEDEALKWIRSKEWFCSSEKPEFPTWRDWFLVITMNRVRGYLKCYQIKMTTDEVNLVTNLISKTMDEFRFWKSKGGYYSYRIGFVKFET